MTILPLYINAVFIFYRYFRYLSFESINSFTLKVLLSLFTLVATRTVLLLVLQLGPHGSRWPPKAILWAANQMDATLLRFFYWFIDLRHSLPELVDKECHLFKQYWFRWIKDMIAHNRLIPNQIPTVSEQFKLSRIH